MVEPGLRGSGRIPLVLIHGAWAGGWVWDRLVPLLEREGCDVDVFDLPGTGRDRRETSLAAQAAFVRDRAARFGRPVILVAHSGAGVLASVVAEQAPDLVAGIVYVAGFMLPDGVGFADLVADMVPLHPEAAGINPSLVWSADGTSSHVPPEAAMAIFFNDCTPADAAAAAARLTPQPETARAVVPRLTAARFGTVRRLYVEALADRSVVLAVQRRMQALVPGADVVSLPTGHAPQFSAPARLVAAIVPWLRAGAKAPGDGAACPR